ncbi:MAG: amidohydrolase family protein [Syntrophomonadaceae bacterium]|nr:amidohydrolase family protein [Syntrophomonadaceae bacterium]
METKHFLDAHLHAWEFCLSNYFTNLASVTSLEELIETLQNRPINGWLVGVRFNQETLAEKVIPDKAFLDHAFGARPVLIVRTCLHLVIMNTAAMEQLNRYSSSGIFLEANVFAILEALVTVLQLDMKEIVEKGLAELRQQGITRFIDMGMDSFRRQFFDQIDYYTTDYALIEEALGFKLFLDGGLGARTGALTEEYSDAPGHYGLLNYTDKQLLAIVDQVHQLNKPVALHAVGDRALDQAIHVLKESRHPMDRVEHLQYTRLDQLDTLAKLEILVCIQPIFSREIPWAKNRLGPKRMETAYAWGLMLQKGLRLLVGSDAPVDAVSPVEAAAVVDSLEGNQHLDFAQTLDLYAKTNWSLYHWDRT